MMSLMLMTQQLKLLEGSFFFNVPFLTSRVDVYWATFHILCSLWLLVDKQHMVSVVRPSLNTTECSRSAVFMGWGKGSIVQGCHAVESSSVDSWCAGNLAQSFTCSQHRTLNITYPLALCCMWLTGYSVSAYQSHFWEFFDSHISVEPWTFKTGNCDNTC